MRGGLSRFASYMHWLALDGLVEPAGGWIRAIRDAGYDGVQFIEPLDPTLVEAALAAGLRVCGSGRVNAVEDAERLAGEAWRHGLECLTLHVGWGIEDDDEAARLLGAILDASIRHDVPLFVETHRATLFQDIWRSVGFVQRFPDLRFNADFSHWYTGLEFVYGGLDRKLAFIAPIVDRVEFMHGRIGDPGCMQVDIGPVETAQELPFVQHFRTMCSAVFHSYHRRHGADATFRFAPELLAPAIYYGRTLGGRELSDRWSQSMVLTRLARDWFEANAVGERQHAFA
ncbi:MAG TPA: hypothetical protein VK533_09280 [Sphingomonas sp.]|uniref:sugar phosphate isomerase/epimerase family protein n=1 Tax=Sphingomonas sp. TaxID=28214 RepID=UPI002BBE36D7|nr:hypothetical protein [Sphingomonas sp.]HMI19723.1 hypothetical protein [Sphingomonas sp.]